MSNIVVRDASSSSLGSSAFECDEIPPHLSFSASNQEEIFMRFNYYITKLRRYCTAIAALLLLGAVLVSFYGIIIMNLFFFASSMVSYTLLPVYHGFCQDWFQFSFGIIQVIVNCPFIQFYILFIIASAKKFIGILPQSYHFLLIAYYWSIDEKAAHSKMQYNPWRQMESGWMPLVFLILSILGIGVGGALVWLLFVFKEGRGSIIPGLAGWVLLVLSIIRKVSPAYTHYLDVLNILPWVCRECAKECGEWNWTTSQVGEKTNAYDDRKLLDEEIQTYESMFIGKVNEQVYVSEGSIYSESIDSTTCRYDSDTWDTFDPEQEDPWKIFSDLLGVFFSEEYEQIYRLGQTIRNDIRHAKRNRGWLIVFSLFNVLVVGFDIYRLTKGFNGYFLTSVLIRIVALPLTSYFHCLVVFFQWDNFIDVILKYVMLIGSLFTWIVVVVSAAAVGVVNSRVIDDRIADMPHPTVQQTYGWNHNNLSVPVCSTVFDGMSVLDVVSFSLGVYDIARDEKVFKTEMQHFFGADWEENIDYEVHWISKHVPVGVYDVKDRNTTVFAFRGFDTGQELAIQIELFAIHYVLPYIEDIMPLHELFVDGFLKVYTIFAHTLGMYFFDPKLMIDDFVPPVLDLYNKLELEDKRNVVFVGSNVGGVLAKIAGMKLRRPALGFISFPAFNDFFQWRFDLENEMAVYTTNVYNFEGLYTAQEPGLANNIGVPWVSTSFLKRDSIYQSFCTIVETCQMNARYEQFCHTAIGRENMDLIREYFNGDSFHTESSDSS